MKSPNKRRIQIDLSGEILKDIDELKTSSGLTTKNVFRNALTFYAMAKKAQAKGTRVIFEKKNKSRHLVIVP